MALASRSSRRGGGRRWIIVGLVLTLLVLLVDASINSRSQAPVRQQSGQAWVDAVLPIVSQSNLAARELQGFRTTSASLPAAEVESDLNAMVTSTAHSYTAIEKLRPPNGLESQAGLLAACLLLRKQATSSFAAAIRAQIGSSAVSTATSSQAQQVAAAIKKLQVADFVYQLFSSRLPKSVGGPPPASTWVTEESLYGSQALQVWLSSLSSRIHLPPAHKLVIVALSTSPGSVGSKAGVETLTPSSNLQVTVVIGNEGNQEENDLTVRASISSPSGPASASTTIDSLAPGYDQSLSLGPLGPRIGVTVTLTITVTAPAASSTPTVTKTLPFEMPSLKSTTTTSTPAASTTKPGHKTKAKPPTTTPPSTT